MDAFDALRYPVADKSYRCLHCRERIAPGKAYAKFVGKFEGDFQCWRMHSECWDAEKRSRDEYSDGSICEDHRHARGESCVEYLHRRTIVVENKNVQK